MALTREQRELFFGEQEQKTRDIRPRKSLFPKEGSLFASRNRNLAIREANRRKRKILIVYRNLKGEQKSYELEAYSFRFEKTSQGFRKMLYAWDENENNTRKPSVKKFFWTKIRNIAISDDTFEPRFRVEIR